MAKKKSRKKSVKTRVKKSVKKRVVVSRPTVYMITARRGKGPRMHYDGKHFNQRTTVKTFSTVEAARAKATDLVKRHAVLRKYRVAIETVHRPR